MSARSRFKPTRISTIRLHRIAHLPPKASSVDQQTFGTRKPTGALKRLMVCLGWLRLFEKIVSPARTRTESKLRRD